MKVENRTRKKLLAVAKHVWLYSDLLQALRGEHFTSDDLSALGSKLRDH